MPLPKYTQCDNTYSEDGPMLKITPEKLCAIPFLTDYECAGKPWSSANCGQFSMEQLSQYNCMTCALFIRSRIRTRLEKCQVHRRSMWSLQAANGFVKYRRKIFQFNKNEK